MDMPAAIAGTYLPSDSVDDVEERLEGRHHSAWSWLR